MVEVPDAGIEYAHIVIAGKSRSETFDFALSIPGPPFVGTNIRLVDIYPGKNVEDLQLDGLRTIFRVALLHSEFRRYAGWRPS